MFQQQYPKPKIVPRKVNQSTYRTAMAEGYSKLISRVIAARQIDPSATSVTQALKPNLRDILAPHLLKDIDKAVERLITAKNNQEYISLAVDFDADGQTSLSILYRGLVIMGFEPAKLMVHCSHRLKEGYGLNDKLVDRILEGNRPTLIVTADNGSSNASQIERLANEGIDVIVTDHHALLDGPPPAAYAVVNPVRKDCDFPDKSIAGCSVAFFLLLALRMKLIESGALDSSVSIANLLTFTGVGVQADCVHLGKSMSNRAMVRFAIASINRGSEFVCWNALKKLGRDNQVVDSEFLSFTIAPAINAAGRLEEARHAGDLFLTDDLDKANKYVAYLNSLNEERKIVERNMSKTAKQLALKKYSNEVAGLCVFLSDGNPGVIGIVASRVMQTFGKPVCVLAPMIDSPDVLSGSLRTIDGYSIKDGIDYINSNFPELILRGGGHDKAGGVSFYRENLSDFEKAFNLSVCNQVEPSSLVPLIETDGPIEPKDITCELLHSISDLQPFGQGFPKPVFELVATPTRIKMVGTPKVHTQLIISVDDLTFNGIWFFSRESESDELPITTGNKYRFIFSVGENNFNNHLSVQLIVTAAEKVD